MKKILAVALMMASGSVFAAAGDQTLSVGYIQMKSDGLEKLSNNTKSDAKGYAGFASSFIGAPVGVKSDSYSDPQGMFIRYRYEFDDSWSIIGSLAYAQQDTATKGSGSKTNADKTQNSFYSKAEVTGDYVSALVGPAYRLNEYVSLYGMAGAAYKHVKQEVGARAVINDRIAFDESHSNTESKTSLAYSIGAQFNVYKSLVIDAAYEGSSGGNDWKANGFTVGIGYKF